MKQFNGFEEAKKAAAYTGAEKLPVGAYECKVLNVKYREGENDNSDMIDLMIDVTAGEHKDFFKKQYDANTADDKKWKGKVTLYVPKDDGSEKDEWTKNAFARWTNAFEASNPGYTWDWDENKWKNKKIGLVFGPTGTVIEGKEVLYHEVHGCCSIEEVKAGTFYSKYLELKKKNGYKGNGSVNATSNKMPDFMDIPEGTSEEIPF